MNHASTLNIEKKIGSSDKSVKYQQINYQQKLIKNSYLTHELIPIQTQEHQEESNYSTTFAGLYPLNAREVRQTKNSSQNSHNN
jgi:hypothetical protein